MSELSENNFSNSKNSKVLANDIYVLINYKS